MNHVSAFLVISLHYIYFFTLAEYFVYSRLLFSLFWCIAPAAQKVMEDSSMKTSSRRADPPVDCLWCVGACPLLSPLRLVIKLL